jgi:hypothetical protein
MQPHTLWSSPGASVKRMMNRHPRNGYGGGTIFIAKGGSTRQAVLVSGVEAKRAGDTVLPAAPINLSFPPCGGP